MNSIQEIVGLLMDASEPNSNVLKNLASHGDDPKLFREVTFAIEAPSEEQANHICGFITDFKYGSPSVSEIDNGYLVEVTINTPATEEVISCISGFMLCVANFFGGTFNGWGCSAQS